MTAATATSARHGGEVAPDVLRRAKAGDRQAFTEVVCHYDHRLRALAYRLLGDRAAIDDALQEAYVKAFRARRHRRHGLGRSPTSRAGAGGRLLRPHRAG